MLVLVLGDAEDIPGLAMNELVALDRKDAKPLGYDIPAEVMIKLARLQTLAIRESEKGDMPESDQLKDLGVSTIETMSRSLGIQEDATRRAMMLEQLFTEVVREVFPAECDRLDVEYSLHPTNGIMWRPVRRQRFLD